MGKQKLSVNSIPLGEDIVKDKISEKIKVQIHIPDNVAKNSRQQKINRIYDILTTEMSR